MPRRENFTAERVAGFKFRPSSKGQSNQTVYWDGKAPGLGLRVTATGAKSYIFETRLHGKTLRLTIGSPDTWPLETQWRTEKATGERIEFQRGARQEAARLKALTDQGIDPRKVEREKLEAKTAAAMAAEAAKKYTLEKLYEAYCSHLEAGGKNNTARVARSLFKTHVPGELKGAAAKVIEAETIADMLRSITEQGKERTAGALRTYLLAAYNIGMRARLDPKLPIAFKAYAITANPIALIPAIASKAGNRVVSNDELRTYLKSLGNSPRDKALALALFAGGQRMEQILRITSADWTPETKTLRLFDPKGRRKEPRIHLLPLASRAAGIVELLIPLAKKRVDKRLFTLDVGTPGKRVKGICKAAKINPAFDLRDIRRTVETRMAGLGISKDIRAQVLSHGVGGVQDKHYDRHDYATEKRTALISWEDWLTALEREEVLSSNAATNEQTADT